MKKILRLLLLLTPLIIAGLAYWDYKRPWQPPLDPTIPQYVSIDDLLAYNDSYQAPMIVIVQGEVFNKTGNYLFMNGGVFRVNCSGLDISAVKSGDFVYVRGMSYYHEPAKEYFSASDIQIHVSYSLYLSIPGALLILLILFIGFKFKLSDFSFSRKVQEGTGIA